LRIEFSVIVGNIKQKFAIMRRFIFVLLLLVITLVWLGCQPSLLGSTFTFSQGILTAMDATNVLAIAEQRMPGMVLWLEHDGIGHHKAYGQRALEPLPEPLTEDTIFDAASLTKVMATAPSIMILTERGLIDIDAPVQKYIEEFRRDGKDGITVRHLLTHTSGLRSGLHRQPDGPATAIQIACTEVVTNTPGTFFRYSDINFILLGEIVQRVSRKPLHQFVSEEIFRPLGMRDTRYWPLGTDRPRIAPTQYDGTNLLRGVVHDPTARHMGGVAGHAGLFTTAGDLARFARMLLNKGELEGVRILRSETVTAMTSVQSPATISALRGFGWDIDSEYSRRGSIFAFGSYGHTGFTGTSIWIDPFSNTFLILLTNRVHPDGKGDIRSLQRTLATLAAEAVGLSQPLVGTKSLP
jgi:CubicO group peptidase (beta-lactamase class C family)